MRISGHLRDDAITPVLDANWPRNGSHEPDYPTIYADTVLIAWVSEVPNTYAATGEMFGELERE
jgi:hypothetical protein